MVSEAQSEQTLYLYHNSRLRMTRLTSSLLSSSMMRAARLAVCKLPVRIGAELFEVAGTAYTLGKLGAVAEVGLELPSSATEVVGESGGIDDDVSVIRARE